MSPLGAAFMSLRGTPMSVLRRYSSTVGELISMVVPRGVADFIQVIKHGVARKPSIPKKAGRAFMGFIQDAQVQDGLQLAPFLLQAHFFVLQPVLQRH